MGRTRGAPGKRVALGGRRRDVHQVRERQVLELDRGRPRLRRVLGRPLLGHRRLDLRQLRERQVVGHQILDVRELRGGDLLGQRRLGVRLAELGQRVRNRLERAHVPEAWLLAVQHE